MMNTVARSLGRWFVLSAFGGALLLFGWAARAADPAKGSSPKPDAPSNESVEKADSAAQPELKAPLDREQKRLADRYAELEKATNRMAEVVGQTDPKQAALLRQAFAES